MERTLGPAEQARLDSRLIAAARARDVEAARRLVRQGADVNTQDEHQENAFLLATSEGPLAMLELTLRHGARVDAKDSFDGTGMIRAADRGHADIVGRLVRAGTALDHVNNLGWTALHEAVILGDGGRRYVDTVRVLVAAGADTTVPSVRDGLTAREHARAAGHREIARLLVRVEREEVRRGRADAVLLQAAREGDADLAALALRAGADLEARDERRRTALLVAVAEDRVEVARLLVHLGADPDAVDDQQDTPWLVTGVTGSVRMLEVLLPAGPDLTLRNRFGGVSVIPAAERGHVEYVRRVVRTGIDVDHVNDLGWTALLEAVILGDGGPRHQEVVRILLEAGADPGIADKDGVTALEHAERRDYDEIARLLRRVNR
ncbi:MAG TPA: ankyrin repeat domain-containing protein [Nocardioides sp.]|nr:ankyrin repeat domain-containing protein [Nocardioides sp.]